MKVLVYVEGPSDQAALRALLRSVLADGPERRPATQARHRGPVQEVSPQARLHRNGGCTLDSRASLARHRARTMLAMLRSVRERATADYRVSRLYLNPRRRALATARGSG